MEKRHYAAVHTDSGCCLLGCDHKHQNVMTAAACISEAGGYVVAVCRGKYLPLTKEEDAEFQRLMYGRPERSGDERAKLVLNPQAAADLLKL